MIIKSLSRKSNPAQLIQYALRYSMKEGNMQTQKEQAVFLLKHNIRSTNVEGYIKEFKENESYRIYRRKDSVVLFHSILSFAPEDKERITKATLKDMAKKFVELRGTDCLHIAAAHLEKEHKHIHIISSGVKVNGRSSRVSKQAFTHILNELEQYQQEKYPNLIHSKNSHAKTRLQNKEQLLEYLQKNRKTTHIQLLTYVEQAYQNANSLTDFTNHLFANNYELYFRNGRPQGILAYGTKFRFSSLQFDTRNLEQLSEKETQSSHAVAQIQAIRNKESKEKVVAKQQLPQSSEALDELQKIKKIREKSKVHDGLERGIEHNSTTRRMSFAQPSVE